MLRQIQYLRKILTDIYFKKSVWLESTAFFSLFFCVFFLIFSIQDKNFFNIHPKLQVYLLRSMLSIYINILLLNGIFPFKFYIKMVLVSGLVPFIWIVVYSYTYYHFQNSTNYIYYYVAAINIFIGLYALNICLSLSKQLKNSFLKLFYVVTLFILALCPFIYLAYYKIYGYQFGDDAIIGILGTNFSEAKEYLSTCFSVNELILIAVSLALLFVLLYNLNSFSLIETNKINCILLLVVLFFTGSLLAYNYTSIFPFDKYRSLHSGKKKIPLQIFNNLQRNLQKNTNSIIIEKAPNNKKQTIILVIGESANKDFMSAFNSSLPDNTTPWERDVMGSEGFVFFDHAYANANMTVMSLLQALTNTNQYNNLNYKKMVSIIDVAKKMEYETYWISAQNNRTIVEMGVASIAQRADNVKWVKGYDDEVLTSLKEYKEKIISSQRNFIIIHLLGSHFQYKSRYPESFAEANAGTVKDPYQDYKLTLLYTDNVLKQIFEFATSNFNMSAMIYFSDHGEDMKYQHVGSPFYWSMVRIPLWFYLSSEYIKERPDILKNLKAHKNEIFTNDLIFDTVHGLLQNKSNYYEQRFDLTGPNYQLKLEDAKTIWGKYRISEDPNLKK